MTGRSRFTNMSALMSCHTFMQTVNNSSSTYKLADISGLTHALYLKCIRYK